MTRDQRNGIKRIDLRGYSPSSLYEKKAEIPKRKRKGYRIEFYPGWSGRKLRSSKKDKAKNKSDRIWRY